MAITYTEKDIQMRDLLLDFNRFKYNPSLTQRAVLEHLSNITDGNVNIVDPTNPFIFLLEASCASTASFIEEHESLLRRQYPALANTYDDLYLHMSDKDYIGRFASPATTNFTFLVELNSLLNEMLDDTSGLGRKIVIPRNTEFIVNDELYFSMQYPIVIRELSHGGLRITYDADIESPLQSLTTNVIDYQVTTDSNGVEFIMFDVNVQQTKVYSYTSAINASGSFSFKTKIKDSFYHARVYNKSTATGDKWVEIKTTHTEQIHDVLDPTVLLKLIGNELEFSVPNVYLYSNLISGSIRMDVYETRGPITANLGAFKMQAFKTVWRSIDLLADSNAYTKAINNVSVYAYSKEMISGGTAPLDFIKLRKRIISNTIGSYKLPITDVQIEDAIDKKGYQIIKNVDVVTNRIYLAAKKLPRSFDPKLITAGSATIETLTISLDGLSVFEGVNSHGSRVTITPDLIYKDDNSILKIIPASQINALLGQDPDIIAEQVSNNSLLFSPFHYVLDTTADEFELRPYYLENPTINYTKFISQNETTGYQVNAVSSKIIKTDGGYNLLIYTKANTNFKELDNDAIYVQIGFKPVGETQKAWLNGIRLQTTSQKERIFLFQIETTFDIDSEHNLLLNNFTMFKGYTSPVLINLASEFDIIYSTTMPKPPTWVKDDVDSQLGEVLLPDNVIGITHEKISIELGKSLPTLWARSRSIVSESDYERYTEDVPRRYTEDVYELDETGSSIQIVDNEIVQTILHHKGDIITDINGNTLYLHRRNDIITDENNKPIPINQRKVVRQLDLMLIEGPYTFATDASTVKYKLDMVSTLVSWLTIDLAEITEYLLEQTKIYFYPKRTTGYIKVIIDNGRIITIPSGQNFRVKLYVTNSVYDNGPLRLKLESNTIKVIDDHLSNTTLSISTIIKELRDSYGSDVVSIDINGLGGEKDLQTLTIYNQSERCSLRKILVKDNDNQLLVKESVHVEFIRNEAPPV